MNELLDVVDDLTLPRNVKVETDDGFTWASEDALLTQLRDAVSSGLGSSSGGTADVWARNILNTEALYVASLITSQIKDWCRMVSVRVTSEASHNLRAWYVAYSATVGEELDAFYINQLRKWSAQIRSMLNPPKTLQMTSRCPDCLSSTYVNEEGETLPHPVSINYYPNARRIWEDAKAVCKSCQKEWVGEWELRGLRHSVDEVDEARENA